MTSDRDVEQAVETRRHLPSAIRNALKLMRAGAASCRSCRQRAATHYMRGGLYCTECQQAADLDRRITQQRETVAQWRRS